MKPPCCKKRLTSLPALYKNTFRQAMEDRSPMFLMALLTCWIAPCTVWINSSGSKSFFLLASSFTTFSLHSLGLLATYLFAKHSNFSQTDLPPITHCLENVTQRLAENIAIHFYSQHELRLGQDRLGQVRSG